MQHRILGDNDCPILEIQLNPGERVKIERGSMAYMAGVELQGKMNSGANGGGLGGLLSAVGRSIASGESMFITEAVGVANGGRIGVAPSIPGKIVRLEIGERQYRLNTGAFLAGDSTVSYAMKMQDLGKAFFGGTGGLFVMESQGQGDLFVNAFGDLLELEVHPDSPLTIDNDHVVAWDRSLDYHISIASGTFGFTTGEGLVNRFIGEGKVYIQTRNLSSLASALPIARTNKNNGKGGFGL